MKKVITTIAIVIMVSFGNIEAQSDGFFGYMDMDSRYDDPTAPMLPGMHGQMGDSVAAAPVGAGVMLLAGFCVAYAMLRKKEEE